MYIPYIYNGILPGHKKGQNNAICSNIMELEILILSEVKSERERKICHCLHVESKIRHRWFYLQNRNRSWTWRGDLWLPVEGGGSGMDWKFGVGEGKLTFGMDEQWCPTIQHRDLCDWVTLLYSRRWRNTVNQPYSNKNILNTGVSYF